MSAAADRIRAMQEKGTITPEQAEELLSAIAGEEETAEGPAAGGADPGIGAGGEPRVGAGPDGAEADWTRRRRGRRRSGFLDMEWVGDMVDGITSGLGTGIPPLGEWKGPADSYRYEWDHRWSRRRGGNAENSSRVEQPEGESFEFQENRAVFSKLSGMRLVRSKVRDNAFSASTLRGAELTDSSMVDSSLAGASLHELKMDRSEMKDVAIAGSKVNRLELGDRSGMKNVKISGSSVSSLALRKETWIEDTRFAGAAVTGCTLSAKTRIKDTRLSGTAASRLTLQGVSLGDTRLDGCTLADTTIEDTEIHGCVLRGVAVHDSRITGSRIKDSCLDAVGFSALTIEHSELRNVAIRDTLDGRFPRRAERLSVVDSKLEDVQFIGCRFSDTTIKGIKASGLRIRGRDLSGRTIDKVEDLIALSEK